MVFSGIFFLMYFLPLFLLGYVLMPQKLKNSWITIGSLLFYSWGAPVFIVYGLASSGIDFLIGKKIQGRQNKTLLIIGVVINLGLLLYFKYFNFFAVNINEVFNWLGLSVFQYSNVVLPIGISFLTFQKISYLIDVYRGETDAQNNFGNYLLFIFLFPQLIAGPIVRYKDLSDQITNRLYFSLEGFYNGFSRFIFGLAKKVLLANVFGKFVDDSLGLMDDLSTGQAWMVLFAYTFQIYFDFSGYSDMAIGLGKMLGFNIPENFQFPYLSKSITEFWRRWHITLGTWMKDYLYLPLGGNRMGELFTYRNLVVVFVLSGIWHGASWMFLFWGLYHGLFLVLERLFLGNVLKRLVGVNVLYTFFIVALGWVGFRSDSVDGALLFYEKLFTFNSWDVELSSRLVFVFGLVILFHFIGLRYNHQLNQFLSKTPQKTFWLKTILVILLLVICLGELYGSKFNPFIYFKF